MLHPGCGFRLCKSGISRDHSRFYNQKFIQIGKFADSLQIIHWNIREITFNQMTADICVTFLQHNYRMQAARFHHRSKKKSRIKTSTQLVLINRIGKTDPLPGSAKG